MEDFETSLQDFIREFEACQPVLEAIGYPTRLAILEFLIQNSGDGGMRVHQIQESTHLSRPAVSHHLKILKEAGVIAMRKEQTKTYYYLDADSTTLLRTAEFWKQVIPMMRHCQHRKENV